MINLKRKYYLGSASIRKDSPLLKRTEAEVIKEAEQYLEEHPLCNSRIVVQIVGVVHRRRPPVEYTRVK